MAEFRLGVLGGMGPQATNTFFQFVLDRTEAETDQDHINTLILSDTDIPDRTAAILGTDEQRRAIVAQLTKSAKLLERAGCTVLAVPCNTSHYFLDRVQKELHIPIIHMIRETAAELKKRGFKRVGVLGTDGTVRSGIYQKELSALGLETVVPSPEAQKQVMSLIYDDIKAGHLGDPAKFRALHKDLIAQGCDCGVLACTELSVFSRQYRMPQDFYVDAMDILATRAVEACGKKVKK